MSYIQGFTTGGSGGSGIATINGTTGSVTGSAVTITGGTSGAVFTGSGTTLTESFNYLALPTTTSTNGQITINGSPFLHAYGTDNTFLGTQAGNFSVSGTSNAGIGYQSMNNITNGSYNAALGWRTGISFSSGSGNTAVGYQSLTGIDTGSYNVGIGHSAGINLVGGENSNILINSAGNTFESNALRLGSGTGTGDKQINLANISGIRGITPGNSDIQVVMIDANGQLGTNGVYASAVGTQNIFVGNGAGNASSGVNCTALGYQAGHAMTGANNTALGQAALLIATSGVENTAVGSGSMYNGVPGNANTAVGFLSLQSCTGGKNTGIGWNSLAAINAGEYNTSIGWNSGAALTGFDSSNICINNVGVPGAPNTLRIGSGTGTGNQQLNQSFIHGIRGITTANNDAVAVLIDSAGQLGTVSSSIRYKENVVDMGDVSSPILNLRPVTFDFIGKPSHKKQVGLIAEEVEQIMPSLVAYNMDGGVESVKYHELPILLLNELQKALKRIEDLESKLK